MDKTTSVHSFIFLNEYLVSLAKKIHIMEAKKVVIHADLK